MNEVTFTQNELIAIFQLCRNYRVGLYTDEYYLVKGIADKIIASGALNNAAQAASTQVASVQEPDVPIVPPVDTPGDISGV